MGLVLHGDAAFAGQGVVAETLQLGNLPGEFPLLIFRLLLYLLTSVYHII